MNEYDCVSVDFIYKNRQLAEFVLLFSCISLNRKYKSEDSKNLKSHVWIFWLKMSYISSLWEEKGRSHESLNSVKIKGNLLGEKSFIWGNLFIYGFSFLVLFFLEPILEEKILYLFLGLVRRKKERPDKTRKLKDVFLTFKNQWKMMQGKQNQMSFKEPPPLMTLTVILWVCLLFSSLVHIVVYF